MWLTHPPFPTPNPSIPWGTLSPLFLYPASSHVPISSIRHRLAPSHLHPIWRPKTCLLCWGEFSKSPPKTWWNLDTTIGRAHMVCQPLAFELAQTCEPHTPCFCQGDKITFAKIWCVLTAVAFCIKIPILLFSHMWEEFAILATIKPADQQVLHMVHMVAGGCHIVHMVHTGCVFSIGTPPKSKSRLG